MPFLKYASLKRFCLSILVDSNDKSNKVVNDFLDSIILKSGRIPRKLVNILRSKVNWDGTKPFIEIPAGDEKQLRYDAELVTALGSIMDNELPTIASDEVELDFFIAQIHLWISKMRRYESSNFLLSEIVAQPIGNYPSNYTSKLPDICEMLTNKLTDFGLLAIRHNSDNNGLESSYFWVYKELNENAASNYTQSNDHNIVVVEEPTNGNYVENSKFIHQFIEFESFLRKICIEVEGSPSNAVTTNIQKVVETLIKLGILSASWISSAQFKELIKTRNNLLHGYTLGDAGIKDIQTSSFTMSRLKSEVLHGLTSFIIKDQITDFIFIDKHRSGFDFAAKNDDEWLLFEIKYYRDRNLTNDNVSELLDKFTNFLQMESRAPFLMIIYL